MTFTEFSTDAKFADEPALVADLAAQTRLSAEERQAIAKDAEHLVQRIRSEARPSLMEHFLAEYGLSSREGVALMCLAEAMLRVPDADTIDALIEDKIAPSDWGRHLGEASSTLVNASTWALMLTGRVLDDEQPGLAGVLRGAIKRLGEPVIRVAVSRAMKEMGRQFVLGETIEDALRKANAEETRGFTYSYDMLGEAAMTAEDANRYALSYETAIAAIASACTHHSVETNPGISIKLSALHPRYEPNQEARVLRDLVPVVLNLAQQAKAAGMGLNIDAEEQARLVLSLKVIEAVLSDPSLAGWDGFGIVVQAYGKRAGAVIDWVYGLARRLDRRIMVRLVKGAYWDTEMKLAQVEGHRGFPLFTSKVATDVSYLAQARKLFGYADRIYPQFATHNAHSVAAIQAMAGNAPFEFQRLHGMGERLHDIIRADTGGRCRIYAPVGAHRDLLAYLVRRLLENGANSSFVHQIVDDSVLARVIAADPLSSVATAQPPATLRQPDALFAPHRSNSTGYDLTDEQSLQRLDEARQTPTCDAAPVTVRQAIEAGKRRDICNPATGAPIAGEAVATFTTVNRAIQDARPWRATVQERAAVLRRAADLYEDNVGPILALLAEEAGKTWPDAIGEVREAVDFLRYYAAEAERLDPSPRGVFAAISPWNFPLAIFTGQMTAALAAGNAVLAKPAEQTPLIATFATRLLHEAGVPESALQFVLGPGESVGAALTSDPRLAGVVFTGSTDTAKIIQHSMAAHMAAGTPLIAETGGLNAMIVDSTALPEQAVRDIIASAFQSAGQRCSALRCLYLQDDIADHVLTMIRGAMDALVVGDPWSIATDVGPVIDSAAKAEISHHIAQAAEQGRVLHQVAVPRHGCFVAPTLLQVDGIAALEREIFGPVLHVARFKADQLPKVIADINARGYGLTFGLHTRIDTRVQEVADQVFAGNVYINRNQIGAVVGSQPFGGEGLSGTGPKAGGPHYLARFARPAPLDTDADDVWDRPADLDEVTRALNAATLRRLAHMALPGPTGEDNTLTLVQRGPILCIGPGPRAQAAQIKAVDALGGIAVGVNGSLVPADLETLPNLAGVLATPSIHRDIAMALARRPGPIVPLITAHPDVAHIAHERHLCVDTTASGGNATLLAG